MNLKLMTGDDVRQKILCKRAALRALDLVQLEAMKIQMSLEFSTLRIKSLSLLKLKVKSVQSWCDTCRLCRLDSCATLAEAHIVFAFRVANLK